MIQLHDISLSFKDKVIFQDFNIHIEKNANICFSGVSGRGKSSLLRLLQGYIIPDQGEIKISGLLLNEKNIQNIRQMITWIPQNINLTVNNGMELLQMMEVSAKQEETECFLSQLGLEKSILAKDFNQISGGQKQRIIIAICLSLDKEIILMDEPTSSLDEDSIQLLITCLKSLKGKTIITASHNQSWLESVNQIIAL